MATQFIPITSTAWTLVSSASSGYMEVQSEGVFFIEAATLPDASIKIGHLMSPFKGISFSRSNGLNTYARSQINEATVIVTED